MTLSPQRLEKAAEALRDLESTGVSTYTDMARIAISAYLGDTHMDVPKRISDKMICAVLDATDKKHSSLSCEEFWVSALSVELTERDVG